MAYQKLVLLVMGLHSIHSLVTKEAHVSLNCPGQKCPRGYSSSCQRNESSSCIPCEEGTFSSHVSRRKVCRPCSRCHDNEFELWPCTRIADVVCKECSRCLPGFRAVKPCERTRDTVCEKCFPFIECNLGGSKITGDDLMFERRKKGKEKPKHSMTIIQVENPGPNDTKKPEQQNRPSPGFPKVQPTPSSSFSILPNGSTAATRSVAVNSMVSLSRSVEVATRSTLAPEKSIDPPLTPAISAERWPGVHPPTKSEFHTNTKKRVSNDMQGDDPNIPRKHTQPYAEHNDTRKVALFPSRSKSPSIPSAGVKTKNVVVWPKLRKSSVELSTESQITAIPQAEPDDDVEMPYPEYRGRSGSKPFPSWIWAVVTGMIAVVALLVFIGVRNRSKTLRDSTTCFFGCGSRFRPRRPRCPGSSDCCERNSVSSDGGEACAAQNDSIPTREINTNEAEYNSNPPTLYTYVQAEAKVDVHRPTVYDVFPGIRESGQNTGSNPRFITRAEAVFNSASGTLSAPDSNVSINVDSGAIPDGVSQPIFFGVINDDTLLLRDIPETPERTLISPIIQCGPEDINLSKPVEIVLPHCLCMDEVKKSSVSVYRCSGQFPTEGQAMNWEKVPSASEKNCQSKAWFTVKKDSIHIKTKIFSFWSVFACGGPKRKRATVFVSQPSPHNDLLYLRFYIYSDNEDSRKRAERKEKERFPNSKSAIEKPFKLYNDSKHITVWLNPEDLAKNGWELDQTDAKQTYDYDMAYKNGYRACASCEFAVKPVASPLDSVNDFSCKVSFQQEDHQELFLYVNPGITLLARQPQCTRRFSVESASGNSTWTSPVTEMPDELCGREDELVTQEHRLCICNHVGRDWTSVLRYLGMKEKTIENLEEDYKSCKVGEKCVKGLLAWAGSVGSEATTRRLCIALRKAGCLEALEALAKEGPGRRHFAPIQESTEGLGKSTLV